MGGQTAAAPVLSHETMRDIDVFLEDFYPNSVRAGNEMADANLRMAQIRGLETMVVSAARFSEIINYIKNQTGKDRRGQWAKIGPLLLGQLDQLEKKANEIGAGDPISTLEIKRRLAMGWAKQVVAHCLYSALGKQGDRQ